MGGLSLWKVLADNRYSIPPKLRRVAKTKSFRRWCLSRVKTQAIYGDWFDIKTDVRRGDVLSPYSFIIIMDSCISNIGYVRDICLRCRCGQGKCSDITGGSKIVA